MNAHLPGSDVLRGVIRQKGFRVKILAVHVGLDVRTLERCFSEQYRTTPKAWIIRERMNFAPALLAEGLSNKEVAASLNYTCESNFCRDFKRHFGSAPQQFARSRGSVRLLSRFDKAAELRGPTASRTLPGAAPKHPRFTGAGQVTKSS